MQFFFRRRQPGKVEGSAAEECRLACLRGGLQTVFFEAGEDELIERRGGPILLDCGGRCGFGERFEGPEIFVGVRDDSAQSYGADAHASEGIASGWSGGGGRRAGGDPFADGGDCFGREFALRRHFDLVLIGEHLNQNALLGFGGLAEDAHGCGFFDGFG